MFLAKGSPLGLEPGRVGHISPCSREEGEGLGSALLLAATCPCPAGPRRQRRSLP